MSFCSSMIELHFQLCYRLLCVTLIHVPLCVSVLHPQTGLQLPDCWATLGMWPKAKSLSKASKGHPAWACCDTDSKGGTGAYGLKTYVPENRARSFFFFLRDIHSYTGKGLMISEFPAMMWTWTGSVSSFPPPQCPASAQHQGTARAVLDEPCLMHCLCQFLFAQTSKPITALRGTLFTLTHTTTRHRNTTMLLL